MGFRVPEKSSSRRCRHGPAHWITSFEGRNAKRLATLSDGEALSSNRHGARCSALPVLLLCRAGLSIALSGQHCRRSGVLGLARLNLDGYSVRRRSGFLKHGRKMILPGSKSPCLTSPCCVLPRFFSSSWLIDPIKRSPLARYALPAGDRSPSSAQIRAKPGLRTQKSPRPFGGGLQRHLLPIDESYHAIFRAQYPLPRRMHSF